MWWVVGVRAQREGYRLDPLRSRHLVDMEDKDHELKDKRRMDEQWGIQGYGWKV